MRSYVCSQQILRRSQSELIVSKVEWSAQDMRNRTLKYGRSGGLVVLVAVVAMGLAACGPPSSPGVAGLGSSGKNGSGSTTTIASAGASSTNSSEASNQSEELKFAQCMRSHGISNYPDPSANGSTLQGILKAGLDPQLPTYQAALQSCKKYTPAGYLTPAQSAADNAKGLLLSQCMRSHGVPNFPDPSAGPNGQQVINLNPEHIDPNSSIVQAAQRACQKAVPGAK